MVSLKTQIRGEQRAAKIQTLNATSAFAIGTAPSMKLITLLYLFVAEVPDRIPWLPWHTLRDKLFMSPGAL